MPTALYELLPKDFSKRSLEEALELLKAHVDLLPEKPASAEEIAAVETELGIAFPQDYRDFLQRWNGVTFAGSPGYQASKLEVFGTGQLIPTRKRFRETFHEWGVPDGWLDGPFMDEGEALESVRDELADDLELDDDDCLEALAGDEFDKLRIAHRHLVPILLVGEEMHHAVTCIGPGGKVRGVSIKGGDVDPPEASFTKALLECVLSVIAKS